MQVIIDIDGLCSILELPEGTPDKDLVNYIFDEAVYMMHEYELTTPDRLTYEIAR